MTCSSCGKVRAELHPKNSRLMTGMKLFLCQSCIDAKYEPRWILILHGRRHGIDSIQDYIKAHRYVGNPIIAKELV